jgi:hypothetical protein
MPEAPLEKDVAIHGSEADEVVEERTDTARDGGRVGEAIEEGAEAARNGDRAQEDDIPEILREAEELVREKSRDNRWEQREGPFRGFGSPQGKF